MASPDAAIPDVITPIVPDDTDEPTEPTSQPAAEINGAVSDDDDDDDDEDIPAASNRRTAQLRASLSRSPQPETNGNKEDLFGEDDDEDLPPLESVISPKKSSKTLDDEALDSGDDLGRSDRAHSLPASEEQPEVELRHSVAEIATHPYPPITSDRELYLLKVPKFLGIEPAAFDAATFIAPTTDHHSKDKPSADFSPHKTAMKTLRWRRNATTQSKLESNARILRWSDGSLTLQLATDPNTQYQIPSKPLAPPRTGATKPSPSNPPSRRLKPTDQDMSTHTYLTHPSLSTALLLTTRLLTTSLTVAPSADASSDAIARLQQAMQAAKPQNGELGGMGLTTQVIDPELVHRQAEQAEKESEKQRKRRENAEMKEKERLARNMGRKGLAAGSLHAGGLEEDELGMGIRRKPAAKKRRANRTGEIYSDEEEEMGRGRTREDEYEEDDFLVGSDEDEEEIGDEVDEDDIDERIERAERGKKRKTPSDEEDEEEQDAEGEPDEEIVGAEGSASPVARGKRRRVIEDDEE